MKRITYTRYFLCIAAVLIFAAAALNLFNILHPEMMAPYLINNWTVWQEFFEKAVAVNESTIGSVCTFVPLGIFCLCHTFQKEYTRKSALRCLILGIILSVVGLLMRAMFAEDIYNYYHCSETCLQLSIIDKVSSKLMILNIISMILFGCTAGLQYFAVHHKKENIQ